MAVTKTMQFFSYFTQCLARIFLSVSFRQRQLAKAISCNYNLSVEWVRERQEDATTKKESVRHMWGKQLLWRISFVRIFEANIYKLFDIFLICFIFNVVSFFISKVFPTQLVKNLHLIEFLLRQQFNKVLSFNSEWLEFKIK